MWGIEIERWWAIVKGEVRVYIYIYEGGQKGLWEFYKTLTSKWSIPECKKVKTSSRTLD